MYIINPFFAVSRKKRYNQNMKKQLLLLSTFLILTSAGCGVSNTGGNSTESPPPETSATESTTESSTEAALSTEETTEEETETVSKREAILGEEPVKGIYVSAWVAGTQDKMEEMIAGVDATELNTIVIDVKDDEGYVVFETDSPLIEETGATRVLVHDMPALVQKLHDHGIYVIGRLVCFRDAYIDQVHPEWVFHNTDGSIYRDEKNFVWIDPKNEAARAYLMEIADECEEAGFDEIQFDYVRYPNKLPEEAAGVDGDGRKAAITDFAHFANEHFAELSIPFSMDVFGIVINAEYDRKIVGQDYAALSYETSCLSPMVYPSHYADGTYKIEYPDLYPYEVVYASLEESKNLLDEAAKEHAAAGDETPQAIVRPWLQGFTANYLKHYINYGAEQIRIQIQATYDAGYTEWLIWDPSEHYPWDAFLPADAETDDAGGETNETDDATAENNETDEAPAEGNESDGNTSEGSASE